MTAVCGVAAQAVALLPGASAQSSEDAGASGHPASGPALGEPAPAGESPSATVFVPLTGDERWKLYAKRAFWSPGVFFCAAAPALGAHLGDRPPECGQGMAGYGRRLGDRYARIVAKETYEAAGAAALRHEVRYIPSAGQRKLGRIGHALASTVLTYDRFGRRTPHIARIGASFGAEFTRDLWLPPGYRTRAGTVRGVGISLGFNSLTNLLREFTPELKRLYPGK